MKISGFPTFDVLLSANDTLQDNEFDPVSGLPAGVSTPPTYAAAVSELSAGSGHNVIQGNTIGNGKAASRFAVPLLLLHGGADTVGGAQPGQGNVIDGPGGAGIEGAGSVIQGNKFARSAGLTIGDNETVGGPTSVPGTGAGNDIGGGDGIGTGSGDVIQGNHIHGSITSGIELRDRNTVGGALPTMGNLIEKSGPDRFGGGIQIGRAPDGQGSGNVIEHNRLVDNSGDGDVVIYGGAGNHVFDDVIIGSEGINLGGGAYRYNALGFFDSGPNHYQPYPELLDVSKQHATVTVTARLSTGLRHRHDGYAIDLYAQANPCALDSIHPGDAEKWLGTTHVRTDGHGDAVFDIAVRRSVLLDDPQFVTVVPGLSATATAADGSTSELSPCLTLGRKAPSFAKSGVIPTSHTIGVTSSTTGRTPKAQPAAKHKPKGTRGTPRLSLPLFCPPLTTRSCTGSFVLRRTGRHGEVIAHGRFKLAPGQLASTNRSVPSRVLAALRSHHRLHARLTITAHDGAKHPLHKHSTAKITLIDKRTR
jgi:hypothetical protein